MSRFHNLEFGVTRREEGVGGRGLVKDEGHYLGEAEGAFRRGCFEQALRAYAKVLEFNPGCVAAWAGQVRMLIELGELREARLWAEKALERFPREAELLAAKAVALARTGDTVSALAFSDAAVEMQGDVAYVWVARGDVLLARDERRADSCFERAMAMARDWIIPWLVSRANQFHARFSAALKYAQQALEQGATEAVCWVQVGWCQQALGLVGPARHAFEQAAQLDPECSEAARGLAALGGVGWWHRAAGQWRRWFSR